MKQRMLEASPTLSAERAKLFTEYLREHKDGTQMIRLARAFEYVLENMTIRIEPEELIVGNMGPTPRSCQVFPEYSWTWINEELDTLSERETEPFQISEKDKDTLRDVFQYWEGKSTAEICHHKMPEESKKAAKAGLFTIGAPGTGIGHVTVDYKSVLNEGLSSILQRVASLKRKHQGHGQKQEFYEGVEIELNAVIRFAHRFATRVEELADQETDPERKEELQSIAEICRRVPEKPARTYREALQSFWFIHLLVQTESNGHSISAGRFDQYMLPFYRQDIESGRLTPNEATELIEMLWIKFTSLIKLRDEYYSRAFAGHPMFQNLTIGGQNAAGEDACNELTDLIIQATENIHLTQPTVSFRWHPTTPEKYKLKVTKLISKGLGMPGLFNDEIIMPMMMKKGIDEDEAYDYSILGCVEPIIEGKSDVRPNIGYVNLLKILEVTLNNGIDPLTGMQVGIQTGDPREFESIEQLWNAYESQIEHAIDLLTKADRIAAEVLASEKPTPFISALLQNCIENGMTMQEGGAKYNGGGIMGVGLGNVADSLQVIREFVFETEKLDMDTLLDVLSKNYKGYEPLRVRFEKEAANYGNDIDEVDELARRTGRAFCTTIQSRMTTRDAPYHGALFSVSMYIPMGERVGATPDGRKAKTMLSDGVSPTQNRDVKGPTAAMKSVAKLDHSCCYDGTLYNMKFTPSIFKNTENRKKFVSLVDAYFQLGGLHVQFNVVDRETLEEAKVKPELHRNLIVRVAGYSAYFIELDPFVQEEIITRTEFSAH